MRLLPSVVLSATLLVGCAKPDPPILTAKEARLVAVSVAGLELRLRIEAENPNSIPLVTEGVSAQVTLDDRLDLGTVTVPTKLTLPAKARTDVEVPISVKWADVGTLAGLAAAGRPVPYAIRGTAKIGAERLNVDVPFQIRGIVTPQELALGAMRSLPPGLVP